MIALVALLAVLAVLSLPVGAQSGQLDLEGGPNYLSAMFPGYPDPLIVTLLSGGEVDAGSLNLGSGCRGNVFPSADVSVSLESRQTMLRVYFTAESIGEDTTLLVRAPDGSFFCNDDFDGSNPMVEIANAAPGEYRVWVGTYGSMANHPGYLVVTTGESRPGALSSSLLGMTGASIAPAATEDPMAMIAPAATQDPMAMFAPTLTAAAATVNAANNPGVSALDVTLTAAAAAVNAGSTQISSAISEIGPTLTAAMATVNALSASLLATPTPTPAPVQNAGTPSLLTLSAGFSPDPTSLPLALGVGSVDARQMFGGDCRGMVNPLPAVVLTYTGGGALLRLFFTSSEDTTMIVQRPDGRFACGDDYPGTTNPLVDISQPQAGVYSVWLGTYNAGVSAQGTLYIAGSEASDPTTVSSSGK
jgi:hypothetical protein